MNIFKKALLVVLGAGLVVVPSTVDKVEEVNAASAIPTGTVLYFDPQSSWESDGARMSTYFFGAGETWVTMTKVSGTGYYKVTAPSGGYTNFIFVRMNPNATNSWNNNWGVQTADLALSGTNNLYSISSSFNNKWGTLSSSAGSWSTYYEYDLILNYNYEGSTNKTVDVKAGPNTVEVETPTREGYNFLGWSTSSTATEGEFLGTYTHTFTSNVTLYAVWEEQAADDCTVTYVVNGHEYVVPGAKVGESILNYVPTDRIALNNLVAVEWDNEGVLAGDTVVNATKYYTTFDEVKGELNFNYSYSSTFVVFQANVAYGTDLFVQGVVSSTNETSEKIVMNWEKDNDDGKKEYSAYVPTKYDKLTFTWGTNSFTTDRDYFNNAIWYNSSTSNGTWHYDGETATEKRSSDLAVTNVSDMKLRVGTLAMAANGFAGVETYGIRIAKGNTIADDNYYGPTWAASDVAKVDANGNADEAGEYIRWNAVINNIPTDNYNDTFTAVAYVVIDGVSYDICETRTVSVVSLASGYTTSLSGIPQRACQFIVDTYKA